MKFPDLPEKSLLTPEEVAKFLTVSKQTVYNWCESGELRCARPKGVLRIYRVSVLEMLRKSDPFTPTKQQRKVINQGIKV